MNGPLLSTPMINPPIQGFGFLDGAKLKMVRLLQGGNVKAWELVKVAVARGYDTRIGFEDVLTLPDGTYANGTHRSSLLPAVWLLRLEGLKLLDS
jgi:hypothetical protein